MGNDLNEYDKLVDQSKEGTIFHKTWWLNGLKEYYGNKCKIKFYGFFEDNNLIAGMPIPIHNNFGLSLIYHPKLTPYLGTILINKKFNKIEKEISWRKNINSQFANVLKSEGSCIYYSFSQGVLDLQPFKWSEFEIGVRYTYILTLDDLDKLFDNMNKKRRYDIKKTYENGGRIELGNIEDFIRLNDESLRRQKHPVLGKKIWNRIYDECKKHRSCEIFSFYKDDEAIASLFLIWDTKRSYYLGGGVKDNSMNGMSLLIWEAIKYTKEKLNLREFDFEGSNVQSIEFYFRKFGGEIKPIFYIDERSVKKTLIKYIYNNFGK